MLKPVLGSQIQLGHPLANGLVGCWLMNEGSGNKVFDLSGNGKTGTIFGATWKGSKFGSGLIFDGDADYIETTRISAVDKDGNFSISGWFYTVDLVTKQILYGDKDADFGIGLNAIGGHIGGGFYDSGWILTASGIYVANKWYHFVYTLNDGIASFYLDSVKQTGTIGPGSAGVSAGIARIGARNTADYELNGSIDDVMIYNRALSAQEIQQLYIDPFGMFEREAIELFSAMTPAAEALEVYVWDTTAA